VPEEPDVREVEADEAGEAAELLALIDRLEGILARSGLSELEVEAGETTLVLRSAAALAPIPGPNPAPTAPVAATPTIPTGVHAPEPESGHRAVVAPLTGIYYSAPTQDAAPYVRLGTHVVVGQVIGLIEAMKLFNEIKSDVAGRVVRIAAENGTLVKAKQALIEVDPT